jgi:hypothetical protein
MMAKYRLVNCVSRRFFHYFLIFGDEFSIIRNKLNVEYRTQNTEYSGVSHPLWERQNVEGGDKEIRKGEFSIFDTYGINFRFLIDLWLKTSVNQCKSSRKGRLRRCQKKDDLKKQSQC